MFIKKLVFNVGTNCNKSCKYCLRKFNTIDNIPQKPTTELKEWIKKNYYKFFRIVVLGGEPLLYLNSVKELFECVPKEMFKCIITNGTLVDKEFVNYVNNNNIHVSVSYDGAFSKYGRGYDVFETNLENIKSINNLMIETTFTAKNINILGTYKYIAEKLDRTDFSYVINTYIDNGTNDCDEFKDGFDYEKFRKELVEYIKFMNKNDLPSIKNYFDRDMNLGTQLLLDGSVISMLNGKKYGSIFGDEKELENKILEDYTRCDCPFNDMCKVKRQIKTEHICKLQKAVLEAYDYVARRN